jgi:hypothetical protein
MTFRKRPTTLLEAMDEPKLFAEWFTRKPKSWIAWRAFIAALFALPMTDEQKAIFTECTQRTTPPSAPTREVWMAIGRRGGKSFVLALIAVFLACFHEYRQYLAPGERGTVMIIAADKKQARTILRYVKGLLHGIPMLKKLIQRETAEAFDLTNFTTIEVGSASFKRTRGYTLIAVLADEIAFWPTDDAADPDFQILEALRPGLATIPGSMLLCASSPYSKRGALWDAYSRHFGKDSDVLVWQAATRVMNPSIPKGFIDKAYTDDPVSAASEYGAQFRSDLEAFVSREVVAASTAPGRFELAPLEGATHYTGFADAAGGSGADSFTAAVAHIDPATKHVIIDAVREKRPPFSPEQSVGELAMFFKSYRIRKITMDRWGGSFPTEAFAKFGITCVPSEKSKSEIYQDFLPLLNSGRVELLDNPRLITQLCGLERRTARGGRESIDHGPGGHDDIINSVAGASVLVGTHAPMAISSEALQATRMPAPSWATRSKIPTYM